VLRALLTLVMHSFRRAFSLCHYSREEAMSEGRAEEARATGRVGAWTLAFTALGLTMATVPFVLIPWLPRRRYGALPCKLIHLCASGGYRFPAHADKGYFMYLFRLILPDMHTPNARLRLLFEGLLPSILRPQSPGAPSRSFIDLVSAPPRLLVNRIIYLDRIVILVLDRRVRVMG
jgi:hypothetical protein